MDALATAFSLAPPIATPAFGTSDPTSSSDRRIASHVSNTTHRSLRQFLACPTTSTSCAASPRIICAGCCMTKLMEDQQEIRLPGRWGAPPAWAPVGPSMVTSLWTPAAIDVSVPLIARSRTTSTRISSPCPPISSCLTDLSCSLFLHLFLLSVLYLQCRLSSLNVIPYTDRLPSSSSLVAPLVDTDSWAATCTRQRPRPHTRLRPAIDMASRFDQVGAVWAHCLIRLTGRSLRSSRSSLPRSRPLSCLGTYVTLLHPARQAPLYRRLISTDLYSSSTRTRRRESSRHVVLKHRWTSARLDVSVASMPPPWVEESGILRRFDPG